MLKEKIINDCCLEIGGAKQHITEIVDLLSDFQLFNNKLLNPTTIEHPNKNINLTHLIPPKGCLLTGESGCGKSIIAAKIAGNGFVNGTFHSSNFFQPIVVGKGEKMLVEAFDSTVPKILVLENIDLFCGYGKVESQLLDLLIYLIDSSKTVFILATTNKPSSISKKLLGSQRLDTIINISTSSFDQRKEILEIQTKDFRIPEPQKNNLIDKIAFESRGFSPSDLKNLCLNAFLEFTKDKSTDSSINSLLEKNVCEKHFDLALKYTKPASLLEYEGRVPQVFFSDIYGLDSIVDDIKSSVLIPAINGEQYRKLGVEPPKGILMYGPPGVGKSALCYALANESGINTIFADCTELRSMVVGESEKAIKKLFYKARTSCPCIIVFDHFESLASHRNSNKSSEGGTNRIVTTLLTELDGFTSGSNSEQIIIVAVTNHPQKIDTAFLRPGRLDIHICIDLPDEKSRMQIIHGFMQKIPNEVTPEYLVHIAQISKGWSGSDLMGLCQRAAMVSIRTDRLFGKVTKAHLEESLNEMLKT
ncbi:hypothetical protein BB558_002670 [Smittium angustum]|uniref:AAA+ ATPase domain-containing protein n=1 Tax=Smittium angustum TaxID=133377 RepID=A0A2U1J882_SMIAN|nr:hypothetical protein BB558_002670 [Smittium angustum]